MNKTTKYILIGTSVLVGVGVLALVTKKVIKKINEKQAQKRQEELEISLGETLTEQQKKEESSAQKYDPKSDNDKIHEYIDGANVRGYGTEVQAIFDRRTDAELRKLDEYWKSQHKGKSLYYWLDWELDQCGTWGWSNCYKAPMQRLKSLGLV